MVAQLIGSLPLLSLPITNFSNCCCILLLGLLNQKQLASPAVPQTFGLKSPNLNGAKVALKSIGNTRSDCALDGQDFRAVWPILGCRKVQA